MNKSRAEIFYSIAVLIIIPALLAFNTILLATGVRTDLDEELQSRAELANTVLAVSLSKELQSGSVETIQDAIDQLSINQNELKNIQVVTNNGTSYEIVASINEESEITSSDELQYGIVVARKRAVAKNVEAFTDSGQRTRAWNVASPVLDTNGTVIGLVTSDMLTVDVDENFDATLNKSVLIMILSSLAVLGLLINHFRFIGYASLLVKQRELNQTMSDFLSVATHELKAPMSIIKGYISNVTDGDYGKIPDSAKEQLNVAVAQTDRLNELVQDLLNVSRIEQGKIQMNIQPVDITAIINMVIGMYQERAKEKGITITYQPEQQENWVLADAGRVQEIMTNLIDNAVKYSLKGEVIISHMMSGKMLVTAVRDTGIGMSASERSRLFQRFYRVKNDSTKNISGTGLGLWIVKQYIEKMGGKIQVDSLVGSGTEFQVSLKPTNAPETKSVS